MMSVAAATPAPALGGGGTDTATPMSAMGWIAILQEENIVLQKVALQQLYNCVDYEWHTIAPILPDLEAMAEDTTQSELRYLAAAVASKVFFYLEEPITALKLALIVASASSTTTTTSGSIDLLWSVDSSDTPASPYSIALLRAALDAYVDAKRRERDNNTTSTTTTTTTTESTSTTLLEVGQLQPLVYKLLESACTAGQYEYAIGLCLEAREVPALQSVLQHCCGSTNQTTTSVEDSATTTTTTAFGKLLQYTTDMIVTTCPDKAFARQAMMLVATQWQQLFTSGASSQSQQSQSQSLVVCYDLVQTLQRLSDPTSVAQVLYTLLVLASSSSSSSDDDNTEQQQESAGLTALQLVFDLVDTGDQAFAQRVADALSPLLLTPTPTEEDEPTTLMTETTAAAEGTATTTTSDNGEPSSSKQPSTTDFYVEATMKVLTGGLASDLALSFLHKQSNADPLIMDGLKKSFEERASGSSRSSILHNAAVVSHAYLYAGTTNDAFLRHHLDWMKKASNWAKFTATASLGVIHAAHISEAMQLLEPYLPPEPVEDGTGSSSSSTGSYAEGGSLYALGLIHGSSAASNAIQRRETADYVRKHLRTSHANEVLSHGACLAVGLTCMGSADLIVVHELKEVLDTDFAVAGEAAGMAIGMVLVGTGAGNTQNSLPVNDSREELMEVVAELKNYARETQHEKIIRGIAMGLALMNFGQEENADAAIEEMRSDRDPIMRYGAQYATALAYCGTGSNKAVRILLHTAVSDVSDDVRMAAVIGLAFVLFKTPERVPQLVKLLLESFNPHVRFASCMAVGIAMCGTGDPESIALLEPMLDDMADYVRQGALMGTAMIYMQQSDSCNGRKIRSFREKLSTLVAEKHQSTLTKMGAALSIGIIDAGGRNCSLQLGSRNGFTRMTSAVGLALWLQHWHWYPMMHMLSLALTPTLTIGLNKNFKYPKNFEIVCHAKPSQFAYPKKLQEKKEKEKKRIETVTLSTTAKEKARLARKKAKMDDKDAAMDIDEDKKPTDGEEDGDAKAEAMDLDKEDEEEAEKPKKKREPEPTQFTIKNPARITTAQAQVCAFDLTQRYRPIRPNEKPFGVIMLTDSTPLEEEDLGAVKPPSLEPEGELAPPEPFVWVAPPPPYISILGRDEDEEDGEEEAKTSD